MCRGALMPTLKIMTHNLKVHTTRYRNLLTLVQNTTDSVQVIYRGENQNWFANMSVSTVLTKSIIWTFIEQHNF